LYCFDKPRTLAFYICTAQVEAVKQVFREPAHPTIDIMAQRPEYCSRHTRVHGITPPTMQERHYAGLERPIWVWTAIAPESKLLLSIQADEHTLAMAQAVLHQIAQRLAPGCVPLFLSDGYAHYRTVIVPHFEHSVQPPQRQARGLVPKPRWMPLPALLYAQVCKPCASGASSRCSTAWCRASARCQQGTTQRQRGSRGVIASRGPETDMGTVHRGMQGRA
jgi:hypothetical protein